MALRTRANWSVAGLLTLTAVFAITFSIERPVFLHAQNAPRPQQGASTPRPSAPASPQRSASTAPPARAAASPVSETVFKNVQLLKGISVPEFMDTMGLFSAAVG